MNRRKKRCGACKKMVYLFSRGLCKYCAAKRTYNDHKHEYKEQQMNDHIFYQHIWAIKEHKCEQCTTFIHDPRAYNFHHIQPKAKHPELRYDTANILLLCWQCHSQLHTYTKNKKGEPERTRPPTM